MKPAEMPRKVTKEIGAYEIIGVKPGPVLFKKKTINLDLISEDEAAKLLDEGLPYIQKKVVVRKPASPEIIKEDNK